GMMLIGGRILENCLLVCGGTGDEADSNPATDAPSPQNTLELQQTYELILYLFIQQLLGKITNYYL
ncbi:MAG: hypothetical protein EZS28_042016, partial [Streblomastix strix]